MEHNDIYKIAISKIPNIGPKLIRVLVSYCGSPEGIFRASTKQLTRINQVGLQLAQSIRRFKAFDSIVHELEKLKKLGISHHFYLDDDYPRRLKNYEDAPAVFYFKGNYTLNKEKSIAIVGTRKPSHYGISQCEKIIDELKDENILVVSGLAYGIDTTAHRSALKNNLSTVGVLGHGLPAVYPSGNRKLAISMMKSGGLFSEFPLGTDGDPRHFPQRNRVIAMLADAVLVVESKASGGSMITADFGNQYFKDVFAIPGRTIDKCSEGCNRLIRDNKAGLILGASDICKAMLWDQNNNSKSRQRELFLDLSLQEKHLIEIIESNSEIAIDKLHYLSKLSFSNLSSLLLNLEFNGLIKALPGKKYCLI